MYRSELVNTLDNHTSDAARGWAGWALAHPEFGSSVNPVTTRGADYALNITASLLGFENPAASLSSKHQINWEIFSHFCGLLRIYEL